MTLTVGIDIGGTKLIGGVVDGSGRVLATARRQSPATDPEAIEGAIADLVKEFQTRYMITAVGVGAAGFIDAARTTVLFSPNLAWRNEPLKSDLEARVGLPVVVENDANAAAWGEYRFGGGAGTGTNDLLLVTVGTGIGGGMIINGDVYRGAFGIAAEFGHMRVVPDGLACGCGNKGCWEQYASGSALVRNARAAAEANVDRARAVVALAGGRVQHIMGPHITTAAGSGDDFAVEQLSAVGQWLGAGIADLAAALDPAVVVIGGGVSEAGPHLIEPAAMSYRARLTGRGRRPELALRRAQLGNVAGMIGAADLARSVNKED